MSFQFSLQKLLELKEREKKEAEENYQSSRSTFEEMGTQLYELLKAKEEMEADYNEKLKNGVAILELQQAESALMTMKTRILQAQSKTNEARDLMYQQEEQVQKAAVEVKKYERMKAMKRQQYEETIKKHEEQQMDEIATQLYAMR
ncbi:flagellar export protein FliJ [Salsuginibacillus kocurii]|uniref:flagellar export protein FliJ n=1 Tax=Salsuginibacillus kocurii TaxID=427078 RepID=UPI00036AEC30|nr:flagellar export protein FliJ [Salsuginibacillus kocurii]